jgi:3',5'-cyclic AMP phosphodiesterase CpdA
MQFVSDPPISVKIQKMKQRVRWQEALVAQRQIDQTQLVLDDGREDNPEFSFLVVGDSGSGEHRGHNPQRQIAEQMLEHYDDCRFVLHTGDVIYLVGSSEYYLKNFIDPYREFLVGGEQPHKIKYDQMIFNLPFLPVPGNHDYYDLPFVYGLLAQGALPLRRLLQFRIDLDVGFHGSGQGKAYARAFLDYLAGIAPGQALEQHLDRHYTAQGNAGRCLRYEPKQFTRLPNRYYTFRSGGIDFFALDSNTFNGPIPLANNEKGIAYRRFLEKRLAEVEQQKAEILEASLRPDPNQANDPDYRYDLATKLEHLEEVTRDITKQLKADKTIVTDQEQLDWFQQRLIESWHTESVRGRVVFFHHPPYVTEATKWDQAQTLAIRYRFRQALDQVADALGTLTEGRPVVDLVLNGHAHCLEYLRTADTGHADSQINWIVCGGSGFSLRRQRQDGPDLTEILPRDRQEQTRLVAKSHLFLGRTGRGAQKRRPYSFLRIDVQDGKPPKFLVRPFVSERLRHQWVKQQLEPFLI